MHLASGEIVVREFATEDEAEAYGKELSGRIAAVTGKSWTHRRE
jgi:hypothetical protein